MHLYNSYSRETALPFVFSRVRGSPSYVYHGRRRIEPASKYLLSAFGICLFRRFFNDSLDFFFPVKVLVGARVDTVGTLGKYVAIV